MRKAAVYLNQEAVGELTELPDGFIFRYNDTYAAHPKARPLSLTLPISHEEYKSR